MPTAVSHFQRRRRDGRTANKTVTPECKRDGTVQAALRQIEKQGFHRPYLQEGRGVIGVGMHFARGQRQIPERQARIYNAE